MNTGGGEHLQFIHDSVARHRPRGAAWPADPRLPPYPGGAPPAILRGLDMYDPPPLASGTGLDSGWTPSAWAAMAEPSPYALSVGGPRYTHHAEADSICNYKRLNHVPVDPARATAANDYGLNPYDANYGFLREFHRWADDQAARVAREGIQQFAYADRMPGLSTLMAGTNYTVPRYHEYPEPPPSARTDAAAVWATPVTARGYAKTAPPTMTRGYVGNRGGIGAYNNYTRADWALPPQSTTVHAGLLFH